MCSSDLSDAGMVADPGDLYSLTVEQLLTLDGFAEKGATNLVEGIQRSRTRPLPKLLTALGVPHDVVLADYHLSTVYRHPEFELPKIDLEQATNPTARYFAQLQKDGRMTKPQPLYDTNHRALLEYALDEIQTRWGGVEGYLDKEIGIGAADIARLKQIYLE